MPAVAPAATVERTLPSGLKIIVAEDHTSPLAVFQVWYRVGSRDEPAGRTGMSHLLEHMMFKGTPTVGPGEFSQAVKRLGGTDNAFTSKEYTAYFQILPSDKLTLSMEMESDRMMNLILDGEETMSERSVVMEERRLRYEDDPQSALYEATMASAFNVHPYRWPVIGWMSDLGQIEPEDLAGHYRAFYGPANAFVVVAGDVDAEEVFKQVEKYFGGLTETEAPRVTNTIEPPQRGERRVYLRREAELPYVLAAYRAPSFPNEDSYALIVLEEVLSGKSGRLYRSMVYDTSLALSADVGYHALMKDPFLFFLDAVAAPGNDIVDVENALYAQVEELKASPPTEFELKRAKNRIEASFIMGQDSMFNQAMQIGRFEILGDWRLKDRYLDGIRKVTADDVSRVAEKYLVEDGRTVGVLIPLGKDDDDDK